MGIISAIPFTTVSIKHVRHGKILTSEEEAISEAISLFLPLSVFEQW